MPTKALQEAEQALEELDLDLFLSAYAERAVFEDIPAGLHIEDRSVLRAYFEKLFASPGVNFSGIRVFDGGDFAAIEWIWSGLKRDTGEAFQVKGVSVIELVEGKIARESIYYDPTPSIAQE